MKTILGCFARLAPVAALLILGLAGLGNLIVHALGPVRHWDTSAVRWLAGQREDWLVHTTAGATWLAETYPVIAATAVLAALAGWWTRRWWLPAGFVLLTAGETAIYELSNTLVDRPRPAVHRLDRGDPMASFPSGHVAAAVCLYGGIAAVALHYGRATRPARTGTARTGTARTGTARTRLAWWQLSAVIVAVLVPLIVAFCRTYRGMHHPTDVLAGALLGVGWLLAVDRVILRRAFTRPRGERPSRSRTRTASPPASETERTSRPRSRPRPVHQEASS